MVEVANPGKVSNSGKRKLGVEYPTTNETTHVRLPPEPKYEMAIEDATEHTERDRQFRNNKLKLQSELKCQKITEAGILCGDRPWTLCDQKFVSLLYLSIGTEGRRLLTQKFPHDNIYHLSTLKLWEMMEMAFI